jgi:hypothetical protein
MNFGDPFWGGRDAKRGANLMDQLIPHVRDPARFLESYYWSPGGIECMRAILALSPEVRSVLHSFLTAAARRGSINASLDATGALKLFACDARVQ